jgi:hypothetical protein
MRAILIAAVLALPAYAQPACTGPEPIYDVTKTHLKDNPVGEFCNRFIVTTTKDGEALLFLNDHAVNRIQPRDQILGTLVESVTIADADGRIVCSTAGNEANIGASTCYAPKVLTGTYIVTVRGVRMASDPPPHAPKMFMGYTYGIADRSQLQAVEASTHH